VEGNWTTKNNSSKKRGNTAKVLARLASDNLLLNVDFSASEKSLLDLDISVDRKVALMSFFKGQKATFPAQESAISNILLLVGIKRYLKDGSTALKSTFLNFRS
jgi:hypothetical protein